MMVANGGTSEPGGFRASQHGSYPPQLAFRDLESNGRDREALQLAVCRSARTTLGRRDQPPFVEPGKRRVDRRQRGGAAVPLANDVIDGGSMTRAVRYRDEDGDIDYAQRRRRRAVAGLAKKRAHDEYVRSGLHRLR